MLNLPEPVPVMCQFTGLLRDVKFSAQSLHKTRVEGLSINDKVHESLAGKPPTYIAEKLRVRLLLP